MGRNEQRAKSVIAVAVTVILTFQAWGPALADNEGLAVLANTADLYVAENNELQVRLQASPAIRELLDLTVDLSRRASVADLAELRQAVEMYDPDAVAVALGLSCEEWRWLTARMESLRREIFLEFPELREIAQSQLSASCVMTATCGGEQAFPAIPVVASAMEDVLRTFNDPAGDTPNRGGDVTIAPTNCKWGQYTAALLLCTQTGPVFYWACAYLAYCALCSGAAHDKVCR